MLKNGRLLGQLLLLPLLWGCAVSAVQQKQATNYKETEEFYAKFTGPKRKVAVIDFVNKTKYATGRLGNSASDIMVTELGKTDKFILIEREQLAKILKEQKLSMTGAIDAATAIQAGKLLGVDAMVTGSVSQFGVKSVTSEAIFSQSKKQVAEAVVDVRLIDVETGQILYTDSGKGIASTTTGTFLGIGKSGGYDETLEGEALRAAVVQFVRNIVSQINEKPWSCHIAEVAGTSIYLDAGKESGLDLGQELTVFRLGKVIKSPSTGMVIGRIENEIGRVKVNKYFSANGAIAKVLSKNKTIKAGDLCHLVETATE